jgi:primosomal protein N' (replication factor Y)
VEIEVKAQIAPLKALVLMGGGMPRAYWYHCGDISPSDLRPGTVVEVSLQSRTVPGVVVETGFPELAFATKPILRLAADAARVPAAWLELLQWIAKYYFTPLPLVLQACLPKAATRFLFHPPKRRKASATEKPHARDPAWRNFSPTPEQNAALQAIGAACEPFTFRTFLVHGVTGSGKTLVYLHLAERVLALGRRVLVLLPEIALTPQTVARFESFLGRKVPAFHSGLSEPERRDLWKRIYSGQADIVIGARSAALAPLENLGLLIVDE